MTTPPQTDFKEHASFMVQRYFEHYVPPSESLDPELADTSAPEDTGFRNTSPVDSTSADIVSVSAASSEDAPVKDADLVEGMSRSQLSNVGATSWQEAAEIQSLKGKTYKLPTETDLWENSRGCCDTTLDRMGEDMEIHCLNTEWLQGWIGGEYPDGELYKALTSSTPDEKVAQSVWEAIQNIVSSGGPSRKAMKRLNNLIASSLDDSDTGKKFIAESKRRFLVKVRDRGKGYNSLAENLREMREELGD